MKKLFKSDLSHDYRMQDHPRVSGKSLILQPYTASQGDISRLIDYCKANGLTFDIRGFSPHACGCFSIWISQAGDK